MRIDVCMCIYIYIYIYVSGLRRVGLSMRSYRVEASMRLKVLRAHRVVKVKSLRR